VSALRVPPCADVSNANKKAPRFLRRGAKLGDNMERTTNKEEQDYLVTGLAVVSMPFTGFLVPDVLRAQIKAHSVQL